ncbi:MAG: phosphoesterase [Acidobacteriales bacterium]|nr:phosphoesterase [Terriglobales bacterium]
MCLMVRGSPANTQRVLGIYLPCQESGPALLHRKILLLALIFSFFSSLHAATPRSNHVVVVVEENRSYLSVINDASMPYLNSLAAKYGLAVNYYGNVHPSIGNYFMMTTGQVIATSDGYPGTVTANNIVRQIITAGKTWKVYAESLPSVGYVGPSQYPYSKDHNPMAYFSDVKNSSMEKLKLVPFTQFPTDLKNGDLPDLSFIVPNQLHNAHDGTRNAADQWLKANIAPLIANPAFKQDGILIITFDESVSSDTAHGGGHVATVVIGPRVILGKKSTTLFQHQSLLRTIEFALGLPTIAAAQTCTSLGGLFF